MPSSDSYGQRRPEASFLFIRIYFYLEKEKEKKKKKINALSLIVKLLPLYDHYLRETKSQKRYETGGNSTLERQSAHFNNKTI